MEDDVYSYMRSTVGAFWLGVRFAIDTSPFRWNSLGGDAVIKDMHAYIRTCTCT